MTTAPRIAVSGATGGVGGRLAARLAERGIAQRLVVRDPSRAPAYDGADVAQASYDDPAAMRRALAGVETFFMVSGADHPQRTEQHFAAIDAAAAAGVHRVVYTSFVGASPDAVFTLARHHAATEEHLRATGLPHTVLRDNMYVDSLPFMAGDGVIRGPAGDGRAGFVARDDVADVALAVVVDDSAAHDGRVYDVTGRESLSMAEAAEQLGDLVGREVRFVDETVEQAWASRASFGAPDWEVEGWVTSYLAVATGALDVVTDTVERLTGHPPQTLRDFAARDPDALARLRPPQQA